MTNMHNGDIMFLYIVTYIIYMERKGHNMDALLKLLKTNARISNAELAVLLNETEASVAARIADYEKKGMIKGYSTIINDDLVNKDQVVAYIELKVTPQARFGYDQIAKTISGYDEVESVALMSGAYDLAITVLGQNIRDISSFVAQRLAPIDGVISTTTHFFLQKYKENGILLCGEPGDERGMY